jgi:23S rRNA (adenine2503-C2)-methyltransferase
MPSRYDVDLEELIELLGDEPRYRASQVFEQLYAKLATPAEMTNLPKALRAGLDEALRPALRELEQRESDAGETTKWAFAIEGGSAIETVLMAYDDRVTVCVSTQAGCAMACSFCATGQAGFARQLSRGEIVEQVVVAARAARPRRLTNVVFMGMGEPMANYEAVMGAVKRLHDELGISARKLTISTVGIVPGIRRLSAEPLPVNLAVSLHAANDLKRDSLVPINKRYPLSELHDACSEYVEATGRRLSFEWALIHGVNDSARDVAELAAYARSLRAHVNLIPLNPTPGFAVRGSSSARVSEFAAGLRELGTTTTIRATRGSSIDAACGQLAAPRRREHGVAQELASS